MSETRVIHVSEMDRFPDAVYVGRANGRARLKASPFANPFKIGPAMTRQTAITRYEEHLVKHPELWALLPELRGKPLACWCRRSTEEPSPENTCHADVLAGLLRTYDDCELRALAELGGAE